MVENLHSIKLRGEDAMKNFIKRFTDSQDKDTEKKSESYYDKIARQKVISFDTKTTQRKVAIYEDESRSFGEILSIFEGKKLNLRMVIEWPVTSKPYSIASEDGKSRASSKSLLRNYLQQQNPEKPREEPPVSTLSSVVDAMRVVRLIPIAGASPPTFMSWAKRIFGYLEALPGEILHIVFDDYSPIQGPIKVLSKGRVNKGKERKITNLNQLLPKVNEWQDFLTNNMNKYQVCKLLAEFFISSDITTKKTIYVTNGRQCFVKRVG